MVSNDITTAATRSTKASKALDTMRARITKADEARTEAAHQTRAAQVAQAATEAVTANRDAAEAWDALATHAAKGAAECRHGAELADRARSRAGVPAPASFYRERGLHRPRRPDVSPDRQESGHA